jgi:hypothetical protein
MEATVYLRPFTGDIADGCNRTGAQQITVQTYRLRRAPEPETGNSRLKQCAQGVTMPVMLTARLVQAEVGSAQRCKPKQDSLSACFELGRNR